MHAYTYQGTNQSAPDLYGNEVSCDAWTGPEGFKYWTVGHHDARYSNWGHDIVFQDGPTGVTWPPRGKKLLLVALVAAL